MTPKAFFAWLAKQQPGILTLAPGPLRIKIGPADIEAARVTVQNSDAWDQYRIGEIEEALLGRAIERWSKLADPTDDQKTFHENWHDPELRVYLYTWWWLIMFASMHDAEQDAELKAGTQS